MGIIGEEILIWACRSLSRGTTSFSRRQKLLIEKSERIIKSYRLGYIERLEFYKQVRDICDEALETEPCGKWREPLNNLRWHAHCAFVEAMC